MAATHPTPKRILLVEDNFLTRESMSMILGALGYMVCVSTNGQEAINRLRKSMRPDLILLDLRMPIMDGWQLREELKRDEALRDIPIVVISGSGGDEGLAALDCAGYLHKPVDTGQLLQT